MFVPTFLSQLVCSDFFVPAGFPPRVRTCPRSSEVFPNCPNFLPKLIPTSPKPQPQTPTRPSPRARVFNTPLVRPGNTHTPATTTFQLAPRSRGRDDAPTGGRDLSTTGSTVGGSGGAGSGGGGGGRRLFGVDASVTGSVGAGGGSGAHSGLENGVLKKSLPQGFGGGDCGGPSPPLVSARYPPLEHIQNPPQPGPKVGRGFAEAGRRWND